MGKIRDLKYKKTALMSNSVAKGRSRGKVLGAAADALNSGMVGLFNCGVKNKLDQKLEELYPKIYDAIREYSGVLVIVQYQQWKNREASGGNPPQLLSIMVGPASNNSQSAYRKWQKQPKIMQGPDNGMIYGPRELLWFTRDLSAAELIKQLNGAEGKEYWKPSR